MTEKEKELPKIDKNERFLVRELRDLQSLDLLRASLAEFLGTMLLVMYAFGAGMYHVGTTPPSSVHIALETGFFLAVIISTLSTVSGGHVNPAISIGFLLTGGITIVRFVFYVGAQVLGGIAGAGIMSLITPPELQNENFGLISPGQNVTDVQAFIAEGYITFLLLFSTMSFLDPGRTDMGGSIPVVVGLLVTINVFSTWNISGGCMNPARNFGPIVIHGRYEKAWVSFPPASSYVCIQTRDPQKVYWAGPMVGGALGAVIYDRIFSTKVCKTILRGCKSKEYELEVVAENGDLVKVNPTDHSSAEQNGITTETKDKKGKI